MSIQHWNKLLESLETDGTIQPVSEANLIAFETEWGNSLPRSYRDYCTTFGAGELAGWYRIATPSYAGKFKENYDLATKTTLFHEGRDWREYSEDPEQFERALIFADDSATAIYFWDPAEVSVAKDNEYAVYAMFRDWTLQNLSKTFSDFIDICLHKGRRKTRLYDEPPKMHFRPAPIRVSKGSRKK